MPIDDYSSRKPHNEPGTALFRESPRNDPAAGIADHLRNCRIIVRLGVGYDIIDIESCKKRGILVCNVPDYGTEEVANHADALCFAVHRRVLEYDRSVRQGRWDYQVSSPMAPVLTCSRMNRRSQPIFSDWKTSY